MQVHAHVKQSLWNCASMSRKGGDQVHAGNMQIDPGRVSGE